jgi:hypothetical protein
MKGKLNGIVAGENLVGWQAYPARLHFSDLAKAGQVRRRSYEREIQKALTEFVVTSLAVEDRVNGQVAEVDDFCLTVPADCSLAANLLAKPSLLDDPKKEDRIRPRGSYPAQVANPAIGDHVWIKFFGEAAEGGRPYDLQLGWGAHYATVLMKDGDDYLTYEAAADRGICLRWARGIGFFDLYNTQEGHERRFASVTIAKNKRYVQLNAERYDRDLQGGLMTGNRNIDSAGRRWIDDATCARLQQKVQEMQEEDSRALAWMSDFR